MMAVAHGACTLAPKGVMTQTRGSPNSSGKRSTTIVRSLGISPVASACSRRYAIRFFAAPVSKPCASKRWVALGSGSARSSRASAPI